MKKVLLISLLTTIVVGSLFVLMSFKPSANQENYLMVRVFECQDGVLESFIIVSDGVKIIKKVELKHLKQKNQEENLLKINETMNEIKNQGYTLISSNNGGVNLNMVSNYVFEKK